MDNNINISDHTSAASEMQALERLRAQQQYHQVQNTVRNTKKAYAGNNFRKVLIIIDWMIVIAAIIAMTVSSIKSGQVIGSSNDVAAWLLGIALILIYVGNWIPGIMHTTGLFKLLAPLLIIPIIGWAAFVIIYAFTVMLSGSAFLIIDTVKMIIKKPLFFGWEIK